MRACCVCLLSLLILVGCAAGTDARVVTLVVDGETREIATEALTVRDFLTEVGVTLEPQDWVAPAEPTIVREGLLIRVTRVETRAETETRQVPFGRRTVHDTSVQAGETHLLEPGLTGLEELTYRITLEDGVEVDRSLARRVTVQEPRTEIVLVGTRREQTAIAITGTVAYIADGNAWVMRRTTANQRRLTHQGDLDGRVFSLSPDGSHLLFTRAPSDGESGSLVNTVWVIGTSVASAEPVRFPVDDILWAGWDPNCDTQLTSSGCRIAFTTGATAGGNPGWQANNDLWVARLRPGTGELVASQEVLGPSSGGPYGWWGATYAWCPDGRSLAYARAGEVGIVRAYDGQEVQLAQFAPYRTYGPWVWTPTVDWAPEGRFIITTIHGSAPAGGQPENSPVFDVWVLAADGAINAELGSDTGMWAAPAFAPQRGHIAYGRARDRLASHISGYDLHVMDRDGSDQRHVFPPVGQMGLRYPNMDWEPGGERLGVVYRDDLYLVEIPDGGAYQVTHNGGVTAVEWR